MAIKALAPAVVSRVVVDEDAKRIDVAVPDDQLSLAIGRRGQNVRLASMLLGWDIDILTEEEESDRRQKEFNTRSSTFMEGLDVDEVIAQLLVAEGFATIEEVSEAPLSELAQIEGFSEEIATELQNRATNFLKAKEEEFKAQQKKLGIKDDLVEMDGVSYETALILAKADVKSKDDLADLAGDELLEILGEDKITLPDANALIMKARESWFAEEDAKAAEEAAEAEAGASEEAKTSETDETKSSDETTEA